MRRFICSRVGVLLLALAVPGLARAAIPRVLLAEDLAALW